MKQLQEIGKLYQRGRAIYSRQILENKLVLWHVSISSWHYYKEKDPTFLFPMACFALMGKDALTILNVGRRCASGCASHNPVLLTSSSRV